MILKTSKNQLISISCLLKRKPISRHIKLNHINIALLLQEARQRYRKLTDDWTKCCYLSLSALLCLLWLVLPLPSWAAELSQFLDTVLHEIKRDKWSFVKYIVSFSGLKMVFSKLSLVKFHFLHKKSVFTVT